MYLQTHKFLLTFCCQRTNSTRPTEWGTSLKSFNEFYVYRIELNERNVLSLQLTTVFVCVFIKGALCTGVTQRDVESVRTYMCTLHCLITYCRSCSFCRPDKHLKNTNIIIIINFRYFQQMRSFFVVISLSTFHLHLQPFKVRKDYTKRDDRNTIL